PRQDWLPTASAAWQVYESATSRRPPQRSPRSMSDCVFSLRVESSQPFQRADRWTHCPTDREVRSWLTKTRRALRLLCRFESCVSMTGVRRLTVQGSRRYDLTCRTSYATTSSL